MTLFHSTADRLVFTSQGNAAAGYYRSLLLRREIRRVLLEALRHHPKDSSNGPR